MINNEPKTLAAVNLVPKKATAKVVATSGSKADNIPVTAGEI